MPGNGSNASTGPALKPLVRDVAVRPRAGEIGHHRRLAVAALARRDAGRTAHERSRAVGANHEARRKAAPVGQRETRAIGIHRQTRTDGARVVFEIVLRAENAPQRVLQLAVLDDPREFGHTGVVRIELQAGGTVVAAHAHRAHRRLARGCNRLPDFDFLEKRHAARAQRVDPRIEPFGRIRSGVHSTLRRLDQRDPAPRARAREARTDQPAADDDDIVLHRRILAPARRTLTCKGRKSDNSPPPARPAPMPDMAN